MRCARLPDVDPMETVTEDGGQLECRFRSRPTLQPRRAPHDVGHLAVWESKGGASKDELGITAFFIRLQWVDGWMGRTDAWKWSPWMEVVALTAEQLSGKQITTLKGKSRHWSLWL
jgi:hypothetical protein